MRTSQAIVLSLILLVFNSIGFAQQDPLYAQYLVNPLVINPAYTGINNALNANINYRSQWNGIEGQPNTVNVSAHSSLFKNKIGGGVLISNDVIGNLSTTEINVTAAYKIDFGRSTFSYGMQFGTQSYRTDFSELSIYDSDDNAFLAGERGTRVNVGVGAILMNDSYFIGFSVPRLVPSTFENANQQFDLYNQHFYLSAAYVFFSTEKIQFKPSILFRGVLGAPASLDFSLSGRIDRKHSVGIFTRNFNTYGILLSTVLANKVNLGYVFELPTNESVGTNFLTHEISLGIRLSVFSYHVNSLGSF